MKEEREFRIETDSLGERQVENSAYYGIQTVRALENFPITGYHINEHLILGLAIVKKSAAQANAKIGELDDRIAKAIIRATDEIIAGKLHEYFVTDPIQGGAGTSFNMNGNEVIANRALEILGHKKGMYEIVSPNSHVNMAQSTNDAVPTAIRIAILRKMDQLLEVFTDVENVLIEKATEFDGVLKMGRTHLQDAIPIRLGQEFTAYARVVGRDLKRVRRSEMNFYEVNMGATAVGTGLNAEPAYIEYVSEQLAKNSGFALKSAEHLVDATQNTDAYVELSSVLKGTMINFSKIANDLRLMASGPRAGLQEINLPARQPGSSIMPGKVNPVMAELINQVAFQVMGNDQTVSLAAEAGQFELNVMEPVLVFNLLQSLEIMTNGLRVFKDYCLNDITANTEQLSKYVEEGIGLVTAINPHVGYEISSKIAREALETDASIRDLCLKYDVLSAEELDVILDSHSMTEPGIAGKHRK